MNNKKEEKQLDKEQKRKEKSQYICKLGDLYDLKKMLLDKGIKLPN